MRSHLRTGNFSDAPHEETGLSTHPNSKVSSGAGSALSQMSLCHLNTPTTTKTKMGILYLQHFAKVHYIIGFDISQITFEFLE